MTIQNKSELLVKITLPIIGTMVALGLVLFGTACLAADHAAHMARITPAVYLPCMIIGLLIIVALVCIWCAYAYNGEVIYNSGLTSSSYVPPSFPDKENFQIKRWISDGQGIHRDYGAMPNHEQASSDSSDTAVTIHVVDKEAINAMRRVSSARNFGKSQSAEAVLIEDMPRTTLEGVDEELLLASARSAKMHKSKSSSVFN